jgi:aspartate/methionine/tyrosine aminotransferase
MSDAIIGLSEGRSRPPRERNGAVEARRRLGPVSFNPNVGAVASPPIPEARGWAARYDGAYGPAIDLTQAVPGYAPHPDLMTRMAEAARRPETYSYGAITGDLSLREAYAADVSRLYEGRVEPNEVAITTGANMASLAVTMLVAKAGDAIMLPVPWYFNHQMNAGLLGVDVVPLPCRPENGFVPDVGEAARRIGPRVKAIFLVSPNNPTGAVYPPETVAAFADLCRKRGILLVVDETYRDFRPADLARPHDLLRTEWQSHVVQLYSFSKSYCVPGFRAGAVLAGRPVMAELTKILDCMQICAPRIGQAGLSWAIDALGPWRDGNRVLMNRRGRACRDAFDGLPRWALDSQGAYFAYLRHPFEGVSSWRVAEELAVHQGVVTLPGAAFGPGQENHLRLAFANVDEAAIAGVAERLRDFRLSS